MEITDQNDEVWTVEDLKLYFDAEGYIQYGYQPNGLFVISGQDGPEAKGWPGITLTKHPKVLRTRQHRLRLVTAEEFEHLTSTQKGAMPPRASVPSPSTQPVVQAEPPPVPKGGEKTEQTPLGPHHTEPVAAKTEPPAHPPASEVSLPHLGSSRSDAEKDKEREREREKEKTAKK